MTALLVNRGVMAKAEDETVMRVAEFLTSRCKDPMHPGGHEYHVKKHVRDAKKILNLVNYGVDGA